MTPQYHWYEIYLVDFAGTEIGHVNPGAVAACVFGALSTIGLAASGITAVCLMGPMGIPIATTCAASAAVLTKKTMDQAKQISKPSKIKD
ncbi:hypothetical protein LguiB_009651 [Lonicera macranthoides]